MRILEIRDTPNADGFGRFTIRSDGGQPFVDKKTTTANDEVDLFVALADWLVPMTCPACTWFGMRDDCRNNSCPNCGAKPERDRR